MPTCQPYCLVVRFLGLISRDSDWPVKLYCMFSTWLKTATCWRWASQALVFWCLICMNLSNTPCWQHPLFWSLCWARCHGYVSGTLLLKLFPWLFTFFHCQAHNTWSLSPKPIKQWELGHYRIYGNGIWLRKTSHEDDMLETNLSWKLTPLPHCSWKQFFFFFEWKQ